MSLPRERRLVSSQNINNILRDGQFFRGNYCHLIRGTDVNDDFSTRAAFIVSTKTASLAVDRNRIKRLMKESFRLKLASITEGHHLVFIATRKAKPELKRQDFDRDVNNLLKEANLVEKNNRPVN